MARAFSLKDIRRASALAAVAAATLVVAGCGGAGQSAEPKAGTTGTAPASAAAAGDALEFTGTEYAFAQSKPNVSAGPTTIRFINKGLVEHDLTIDALKVQIVAKPGKSAEASTMLKAGTYETYCSIPGHKESGMHGTLTVS